MGRWWPAIRHGGSLLLAIGAAAHVGGRRGYMIGAAAGAGTLVVAEAVGSWLEPYIVMSPEVGREVATAALGAVMPPRLTQAATGVASAVTAAPIPPRRSEPATPAQVEAARRGWRVA